MRDEVSRTRTSLMSNVSSVNIVNPDNSLNSIWYQSDEEDISISLVYIGFLFFTRIYTNIYGCIVLWLNIFFLTLSTLIYSRSV